MLTQIYAVGLTPVSQWQAFFDALSRCTNFEKLTISFTADGTDDQGHDQDNNELYIERAKYEATFIDKLVSAVSRTLRCLEVDVDIRGGDEETADFSFDTVDWLTIGCAVKKADRLEAASVRYRAFWRKKPRWTTHQRGVIKALFPQLPILKCSCYILLSRSLHADSLEQGRRPYSIILSKSQDREAAARHMLREVYGSNHCYTCSDAT